MKQSIKLERAELASLFSTQGFTLYLRDGQDITLLADRADLPENGKPTPAPNLETSIPSAAEAASILTRRRKRQGRRGGKKPRGSRAERSAAKKEIFFQVLRESGDIKKASKAAKVTTSMGYRWRANQGRPPSIRKIQRGRYRRALNPRSRDFNQARELTHWCRPCNLGFPNQVALEKHQQKKHGLIIRADPGQGI